MFCLIDASFVFLLIFFFYFDADEERSYAIYLYQHGLMNWKYVPGRIIQIGYVADTDVMELDIVNSQMLAMISDLKGNTGKTTITEILLTS